MKQLLLSVVGLGVLSFYFTITLKDRPPPQPYVEPVHNFLRTIPHTKAISLRKLRLCDTQLSIQYRGNNWVCKEDPTCVKCQEYSIKRHNALLEQFEKYKEDRIEEYRQYSKDEPIVLVSLNAGYEKLFRNFLCSLEKNNIEIQHHFYILPCEKSAVEMLKGLGVPHSKANQWMDEFKIDSKFKGTNVGHHYLINALLFVVMNEMIQEGYSVLMMDSDVIFKKNPLPHLKALMTLPDYRRVDFIGQHTGRADDRSPFNTGFIFFKPTHRTKTLTQTLRNAIGVRPARSDQLFFNTMIKNHNFHDLNYEFFDMEMYYKRGSHAAHTDEKIIYHAVGPDKEEKFKSYNDWFLFPECSFYKNMTDYV